MHLKQEQGERGGEGPLISLRHPEFCLPTLSTACLASPTAHGHLRRVTRSWLAAEAVCQGSGPDSQGHLGEKLGRGGCQQPRAATILPGHVCFVLMEVGVGC